MNELQKVNEPGPVAPVSPIMPLMGNLVATAMPVSVRQMDPEAGIIPNFFFNIKLGQVAKAAEREASIAECKSRAVRANTEAIFNIVTLSAKIEDQFDLFRHNKEMRIVELDMTKQLLISQQLSNMRAQLEVNILQEKSKEEIEEQRLKNEVLKGEVRLNDIEVKIKTKQLEEILGGTNG
jgi:hypothetical protein